MPDSTFFRPELFEFLQQLRRHNNREWLAKNKARCHEAVLEPALLFFGSFVPHLAKVSPFFVADPRPDAGCAVPNLSGHPLLPRQAPVQDARRNAFIPQQQKPTLCNREQFSW